MAKLKSEAIVQADLLEFLNVHSDFNFELSVLKMLREHGVDCEHGGHYEDPVTSKSREFDIRAIATIGNRRLRMPVECKNIRENFPILISCVPRRRDEAYHEIVLSFEPGSGRDHFAPPPAFQSRVKVGRIGAGSSFYEFDAPVGKSTVQVGRTSDGALSSNDSELYEKWGQCLSSADELVGRAYWDGSKDEQLLSTVVPFVVVPNGRLWATTFDADGVRLDDPRTVDRVSCFIGKEYEMGTKLARNTMTLSHVEIVTFDGLSKFVLEHLQDEGGMERIFPRKEVFAALS